MSNAKVSLTGDKGLEEMCKNLPGASFRRILRPSVSAAAIPIVNATKMTAPQKTKALYKSLGKKVKTYNKTLVVAAVVGARRGDQYSRTDKYGRRHVPSYYGHIVERGAKAHLIRTARVDGKLTKTSKAKHVTRAMHPGFSGSFFLKRGFESSVGQSVGIVRNEMARRAPIEAKRLADKGKR